MFRLMKIRRVLLLLAGFVLASMIAQPIYAWQVSLQYGHLNRFGGEANSGWHRGQVELAGAERRVRAGDDYIRWTQAGINYWTVNGNGDNNNRPAMVYHAFQAGAGANCGDIRIANVQWSWQNTPNTVYYAKRTCWSGNYNEIRFMIYGFNQLIANQPYYVQHLFKDEKWSGSGQMGTGKITVDTYHDRNSGNVHWGFREDYHNVFCVSGNQHTAIVCP